MKFKYSWIPDTPDPRDFKMKVAPPVTLPPKMDNAGLVSTVYNQGFLGSCTGNSSALAFDFARAHDGLTPMKPSRLMIYYDERVIEGTVKVDAGAMNRDAIKTLADTGVCTETTWPYIERKFAVKPSKTAYRQAASHKVSAYYRVENTSIQAIKSAIFTGVGFIFGISVFSSFESPEVAKTGIIPMPDLSNESMLGGHSVYALGYDDETRMVKARNSWGEEWGDKGHFYIPYAYLTDPGLADDFWNIQAAK
jgi:C1A family cysteine protease